MKKNAYIFASLCLLALLSCARQPSEGLNDDAKVYFASWISDYSSSHPGVRPTGIGSYILDEIPGSGKPAADSAYVRVSYSCWSLDGELASTTSAAVAKQNGTYSKPTYYGPVIAERGAKLEYLPIGLENAVNSMNAGGRMRIAIPGWLSESAVRYANPENYLKKCSGTDMIYDITLVDAFGDVDAWERDSLARFMAENYPGAEEDPAMQGFYYVCLNPGEQDEQFNSDSTIYINYIGRLLNGTVFDTTLKDTATVWKINSSSSTYAPRRINWFDEEAGKDYTSITMGESDDASDIITGFAYALSKMHPGEKGICFFTSYLGYYYSGSGTRIPAYAPLSFEIEMTEN